MDELIAIKDRAWDTFSRLPGVHAVGIGQKVVGGVRTDETVLTVFVTRKRALDELSPEAVVPALFEGVKTDIVERAIPRTLAGPISVTEQVIPNGKSFTFTGDDPPPKGVRIVLTVTLHAGQNDTEWVFHKAGDGATDLFSCLLDLSIEIGLLSPIFHAATPTRTTLEITATRAGSSLDASCYILLADREAYAHEYLRGGILIQSGSGSGGTLGCLATLAPTPQFPQGRIVGVTCSHVVRAPRTASTRLEAKTTGGTTIDLSLPTDVALPAHTLIIATFKRVVLEASVFYTTSQAEPLNHLADGLAAAITGAGLTGVTAAAAMVEPGKARIAVSGFSGQGALIGCLIHGPMLPVEIALRAKMTRGAIGEHIVEFDGSVASANLGVFIDIDHTGFAATFGVFQNPPNGQRLGDLAQAISTAINLWPSAQRGLVSATAVGRKVTISGATSVRVWVERDLRVGQPIEFFQNQDAPCCNFRIGRVLDARLDVDVALVQLDSGIKYKHHVQEVNAVAGTQTPVLGLAVQKRGIATGLTEGMVSATAVTGFVKEPRPGRVYHNAVVIDSTILDTGGKTRRAFAMPGDSGSAVVTTGPGLPKVVGVLFAGGGDSTAYVTPIQDVVNGFSDLGLSFDPGYGVDLSAVHTVPEGATQFHALRPDDERLVDGPLVGGALAGWGERMREAEHEIASIPIGREYAELVRRNLSEAFDLVNHNRRVATVWHRSGGPELLNAMLRVIRFDDEPLPREINGRPLAECLASLTKIFLRYASAQLSSDMARFTSYLPELSGLTYPQMLATLRAESAE